MALVGAGTGQYIGDVCPGVNVAPTVGFNHGQGSRVGGAALGGPGAVAETARDHGGRARSASLLVGGRARFATNATMASQSSRISRANARLAEFEVTTALRSLDPLWDELFTLLAPDITEMILDGRLPKVVGLAQFIELWPGSEGRAEEKFRLLT
ncbi:hypothetical protein WCLP8_5380004 [uncultured Gammaproteobacteria bacterium]